MLLTMPNCVTFVIRFILIALTYFSAGWVSMLLAVPTGFASPVWLPAGIALGCVVIYGYRFLPAIFLGAIAINASIAVGDGASVYDYMTYARAGSIAFGVTLQAAFGTYLALRFVSSSLHFSKIGDILYLGFFGGPIACVISAVIGPVSLFVFGVIPADALLHSVLVWWMGDVIGVVLLASVTIVVLNPKESRLRKVLVAVPKILLCAVVFIAFSYSKAADLKTQQKDFENRALVKFDDLKGGVEDSIEIVRSMRRFYEASSYVDRHEFSLFTTPILRSKSDIQALEWIPKVEKNERRKYEEEAIEQGFRGFQIFDSKENGAKKLSSDRSVYYPVYYMEPYINNEHALGYDLGSSEKRLNAMMLAARKDRSVLSEKIKLVQQEEYGVLIFEPIYKKKMLQRTENERLKSHDGFVVGVIKLQTVFDRVFHDFQQGGLRIYAEDITDEGNPDVLYGQKPGNSVFSYTDKISVGERTWRITAFSTPDFFIGAKNNMNLLLIVIGGFLFVSIFGSFLMLVTAQQSDIVKSNHVNEDEVEEVAKRHIYMVPVLSALMAVALSFVLYFQLLAQGQEHRKLVLDQQAHLIKTAISDNIKLSVIALNRMGKRWEVSGGTPKEEWVSDVNHYLADNLALTTIEWVDKDFIIKWVEPLYGNEAVVGMSIVFDEKRREALERATVKDAITLTPPLDLRQGYRAFIAYIPLYPHDTFDGFIVGVYDINVLMNAVIPREYRELVNIEIKDDDAEFFSYGREQVSISHGLKHTDTFDLFNRTLKMEITPNQRFFLYYNNQLAIAVLLVSLLVSFLVGVAIYYATYSRYQNALLKKKTTDLQESEEQFRMTINNSALGMLLVSVDGKIIRVNKAISMILGYSEDELLGGHLEDILHPEEEVEDLYYMQKVLSNDLDAYEEETTLVHKDGDAIWVNMHISPVRAYNGTLRYFIIQIQDVTGRHLIEEERIQYMRELENAQQNATKANIMKSEFLANMSHEIRTPLNGIIGAISLLQKTKVNNDQGKYLGIIHSSGETLLALINDILDLSKIEAGELNINIEPVLLKDLVHDVVMSTTQTAAEKGIRIIINYDAEIPRKLQVDPVRLKQILINIVGNAVKFVDKGYIAVNVELQKRAQHHVVVRFSIEDSGIGISEDKLEKIFDKFSQADASTTKKYGGTGLGLAITSRLVEMMEGTLGVQSEYGVGTTFWFEIPLVEIPELNDALDDDEDLLKNSRFMVVDDDPTSIAFLSKGLESMGGECLEAESAKGALAILEAEAESFRTLDVVFTDYQMPEMNGIELAEILRADHRFDHIKVILITAMSDDDLTTSNVENLISKGVLDGFILKPIDAHELRSVISNVKSKRGGVIIGAKQDVEPAEDIKANILLVENELVNQMVATDMLEGMGCTVDLAENGEEALEAWEASPDKYDVIFMDCMMPVMDGFEATQEIRKRESVQRGDKHQIIVAMTANAMSGEKDKCITVGMDDYLAKPVKIQDLYDMLVKHVKTS